jgi:hypothetical protein
MSTQHATGIAVHDRASTVLSAWFDSLLDMGIGSPDALDFIASSYPDGEFPLGSAEKWEEFRSWQLDETNFANFSDQHFSREDFVK